MKKNTKMTRRSVPRQTNVGRVNINLSKVKYNSTCISLGLPFNLSCEVCRPKIEAAVGLSKKSSCQPKRSRDFNSDCWKCHQLWQSKFGDDAKRTSGKITNACSNS